MLFLGFVDDVLDIPWRYKLILPLVAALPLAISYPGGTDVVIPLPLRALVGLDILHLGWIYKVRWE
jgi:UDP-N-acetylglucosamine--dolichyl-phosphate N-acetylglucosaminephosphotransferase